MEVTNPNFSDKAKRDLMLIQSAKAGDRRAYTELLGFYKDSLFFMLLKMVSHKEDAEDLTLEAFEKAFRNLHNYTPNFAFSTWLFKIATNCGIDFLRSSRNQKKHVSVSMTGAFDAPDTHALIVIPEESLNPEEQMIQSQEGDLIKELIKRLSPVYRKILTLRYFEELSYSEIAEQLNIPIGTVKTRIFRSRELLESMMKSIKKNSN